MITTEELDKLKAYCKGSKELTAILARVESINRTCATCGCFRQVDNFCAHHDGEIPPDYCGPCDEWDFTGIPF